MKKIALAWLIIFMLSCQIPVKVYAQIVSIDTNAFVSNQFLSRPTNNSVTLAIVPKKIFQIYFEYGTTSSIYTNQSEIKISAANVPIRFVLTNLLPNSQYFYRLRYKEFSASQYQVGEECYFSTQKAKGSTFKFGMTADSHLYDKKGIPSVMKLTMQNLLSEKTDFFIDLGDTFGDDHNPTTITQQELLQLHYNLLPYFGTLCKSSHFFFCVGNHEGENGYYLLQNPPNNIAVYSTLARKYYYANPYPDNFYTGNNDIESFGIGYPENYYAYEWGDALFVVLDVYRGYTANDKPGGWDWTLGEKQYNWFKQTLQNSSAKFKFVFAHHVRGQGRGAVNMAKYFEWGGYEQDGATWGFTNKRPGWKTTIHQLMVNTGVNVFFQGHDHLFAQETMDGIIYQEVPMPSDSTYMIGMLANADAYLSNQLNGTGHILVTVNQNNAIVDYVRSYLPADTLGNHKNGEVAFTYTLNPRPVGISEEQNTPVTLDLDQNYPNPFNPNTEISYRILEGGNVTLKVFDVFGREIISLVDEYKEPGSYSAKINSKNDKTGQYLSSGIYLYQLRMKSTVISKKAVLLK